MRAELLSHHGGADAGGAADGVDNAHERAPLASTDHWMADWRVIELPRGTAQIVRAERAAPTAARLLVRANTTLAFVTVECSSVVGAFSDAGFTLLAGEERLLDFRARAPFELGAFTDGLHVRSLRDTYS